MDPQRRRWLGASLAGTALGWLPHARSQDRPRIGRVVVVGAGFGGAAVAKYIRLWEPGIEVTLVERNAQFISCPMSNLVLAGTRTMAELTQPLDSLARHGVRLLQAEATEVDLDKKQVRLRGASPLAYDRLVLAPGVDFQFEKIPGLADADRRGRVLHAWKAGPQTTELRARLEALPNGAVFAICVPRAPFRCPPGPYERACLVAHYFKQHKPRSKVVVLDANPEPVSKKALFLDAWKTLYPGLVEYRPRAELRGFDGARNMARLAAGNFKADLFNVIPPQEAGRIALPLINVNSQWVGVDFRTWESMEAPGVHVIGDAIAPAPGMPKSAFMANNQAKLVADAVIALMTGQPVNPQPILANTCYSFVSPTQAMHVASVHKWSDDQRTLMPVPGAGGLSPGPNELEGNYAWLWAQNIWADTLG